jgi:glycosyltransferase involved in cell wall biosynthesis
MPRSRGRILVISGVFPPARIAEADHVFHLCKRLAERGFEVHVLTSRGSIGGADLPFRVYPEMNYWNWYELPRLVKLARKVAPDVIFLWFIGISYRLHPMIVFAPTFLKWAASTPSFVTQITFPIGCSPERHSLVTRVAVRALSLVFPSTIHYRYGTLFRDSDHIIAMAEAHSREFTRAWPRAAAKCVLVPPPPLLPMSPQGSAARTRGRQQLGIQGKDFVFAFFGRLYQHKGLETLLEAFQRLRHRHSNAKLAVVGGVLRVNYEDWRIEPLYELSRTLGIEDDVIWTGEFPWDSDLGSTYLRGADAAVLPFDKGVSLNNSSFAAVAAHGLPTITTRGAVIEAPFHDGENVLLCPPCDPAALASAMERLLVDGKLREQLGSGIAALAGEWFSWDSSLDRTIAAFGLPAGVDESATAPTSLP